MKNMISIPAILILSIFIMGCAEKAEEAVSASPAAEEVNNSAMIEEEAKILPEYNSTESINDSEPVNESEKESEFASELEKDLPDTITNEICKRLPLTKELSPGDRHYCFAVVNKNPKFCEMIEADDAQDTDAIKEKNLCLAHSNKDASYCQKMSDNAGKKTCYFVLSQLSGNINICDDIDYDQDERQLCYFSFVNALYWEDKSDQITLAHCNKLPEPDRSTCMAYKERDVSLCGSNVNCLTYFEQPMSFCTTGRGKALEYCIRDRALTSKNISICETLAGEKRDDCIGDYGSHISMGYSTCDRMSDNMNKQGCYIDLAVNLAKA